MKGTGTLYRYNVTINLLSLGFIKSMRGKIYNIFQNKKIRKGIIKRILKMRMKSGKQEK